MSERSLSASSLSAMWWRRGVPFVVSCTEQQHKQLSCKPDLIFFFQQLTFLITAHRNHNRIQRGHRLRRLSLVCWKCFSVELPALLKGRFCSQFRQAAVMWNNGNLVPSGEPITINRLGTSLGVTLLMCQWRREFHNSKLEWQRQEAYTPMASRCGCGNQCLWE